MADTPVALTLESNGVTANLAQAPDLAAFAAQANAKARLKGLDDRLNPGIIDPAKLAAMVAALPAQPPEVRAALSGHGLLLAAGFGVLAVEPTAADAFGPRYRLTIERTAGTYVLAHADPAIDKAAAKASSVAAQAATTAADRAVAAAEKGRADPDGLDLGTQRWRRAQAARGWRIAAEAWAKSDPADKAAASAAHAADAAVDRFDMPSGGRR
jgi:hypothetical protein